VLFDFGLAARWQLESAEEGGNQLTVVDEPARPLTGQTGSTRYMSPEVALSQPYSCQAEVFSFATILWQMAAHERPFRGMSVAEFEERVARGGERPPIPTRWPSPLKSLLRECWRTDAQARPHMGEVVRRLEACLQDAIPRRASGASTNVAEVRLTCHAGEATAASEGRQLRPAAKQWGSASDDS